MSSAEVWYKDSSTGELYQDRIDSRRRVRVYRKDRRETTSSRAESSSNHHQDSRTPRSRRDSVYDGRSIEGSTTRSEVARAKSKIRDPTREDDAREAPYNDTPSQPYAQDDRRGVVQEPSSTAYRETYDSQQQNTKDYYPRGGYGIREDVHSYAPTRTQDFATSSPSALDNVTRGMDDLQIQENEHYTYDTSKYEPIYTDSAQYAPAATLYQAQEPSTIAPKSDPPDRYVKGTKGDSERIDSSYTVRKKDWKKFFTIGRVFSTLWTDAVGNAGNANRADNTFISVVVYGEYVHSKIRRFVVVRVGDRSVTCLPVTSYSGIGPEKTGIILGDHGFIYSRNAPRKIEGMRSKALKVNLSRGATHLQDQSLVNYGKVYTVETNVKVKDVGVLDGDSTKVLLHYYRKVFTGADSEYPPEVTPRLATANLAGIGAAMDSAIPPAGPSSYPQSSSYAGYGSIAATSGYPPIERYESTNAGGGQGGYPASYAPDPRYSGAASTYVADPRYPSAPANVGSTYIPAPSGRQGYPPYEYTGQPAGGFETPFAISYAEGRNTGPSTYDPQSPGFYAQQPLNPSAPAVSYTSDGATYSAQDSYARPAYYTESAIREDDDIVLPSLETARHDLSRRRESRSDRKYRKH